MLSVGEAWQMQGCRHKRTSAKHLHNHSPAQQALPRTLTRSGDADPEGAVRAWASAGPGVQSGGHWVAGKAVPRCSQRGSYHGGDTNDGSCRGACQRAARGRRGGGERERDTSSLDGTSHGCHASPKCRGKEAQETKEAERNELQLVVV